jgi:7-cyano-7-deazaguanine synthase in queuosine biosynthesis
MRQDQPNTTFNVSRVVDAVGRPLSDHEEDWLDLLWAIHLADLVCRRGANEDYVRRIELSIGLRDPDYFGPALPLLRSVFNRLTHDAIQIEIDKVDKVPAPRLPKRQLDSPDAVCLVSGGLDSACAAIAIARKQERPLFVSFRGSPHVQASQRAVMDALSSRGLPGQIVGFGLTANQRHTIAALPLPDPSQRSRTLLFAGVASLIAVARSLDEITLAENGVMAVNCPLTPGRISSFSTQTAHPDALLLMAELFTRVLGHPLRISNPLVDMTKAEVVRQIARTGFAKLIPQTHSCWITRRPTHCGSCVPCLVRRFAVESERLKDAGYDSDLFRSVPAPSDEHYANLIDYLMFATTLKKSSDEDLLLEFSELTVAGGSVATAPILATHRRWADQVLGVVSKYPSLKAIL